MVQLCSQLPRTPRAATSADTATLIHPLQKITSIISLSLSDTNKYIERDKVAIGTTSYAVAQGIMRRVRALAS